MADTYIYTIKHTPLKGSSEKEEPYFKLEGVQIEVLKIEDLETCQDDSHQATLLCLHP